MKRLEMTERDWDLFQKAVDRASVGMNFEGIDRIKITYKIEAGKMVGYKVNIRRLKSLMMSIYARYSNYFESKRNEYIGLHHSTYGADKFATTETVNEIERNEGFKVDPRSLKEAMARVSTRKPSKGNRTD